MLVLAAFFLTLGDTTGLRSGPRRGHQVHDRGADGAVDHRQDIGAGPPGPVVPLDERAHAGLPDLG